MVGLLLLLVVMHRIQNIVVPPRSAHRARHYRGRSLARRLWNVLLPLDLTRTSTRLAFQLPTLYFLSKQLLLWTAILLQTADLFPADESGYLSRFGQYAQGLEMEDLCFSTFTAICAAFAMESFVRGLDGGGIGLVQINPNSSPFNLIGYSFLLHIYSSPLTHVYKPMGLPSRPDKHVIVSITIPLLQLTIFHILSIRKRWSNHRFFPTALSSALALIHFHSTLYVHYLVPSASLAPAPAPPAQNFSATTAVKIPAPTPPPPTKASGPLYSRPSGSGSFPLLNWLPNIFETSLILTITLTVVLNSLTQLILTGHISRPLLGLGLSGSVDGAWGWTTLTQLILTGHISRPLLGLGLSGSVDGAWGWTTYDEDWGVVLLRVGTASLEATGLRGWGNELPSVNAAPLQRFPQYGSARLGPSGLVEISHGFGSTGQGRRFKKRGLANEVKEVDVGARVGGSFAFVARFVNWRWIREAWRFGGTAVAVCQGLVGGVWRFVRTGGKVWRARPDSMDDIIVVEQDVDRQLEHEEGDEAAHEELYGRFLRQEEISDDDEDAVADAWGFAESSDDDDGNDDGMQEGETVGIYTDLAESASTPLLLAHLTRTDELPLTRRRYDTLLAYPVQAPGSALAPVLRPPPQPNFEDDSRRNCVIWRSLHLEPQRRSTAARAVEKLSKATLGYSFLESKKTIWIFYSFCGL
uniref:Uncharacterized protein n=1 Tax=Mycena chlorophos TaxID=658473 RepID=A0ABQ0LJ76_MYCCL|nr:predicted protein [Mycena chlorophos]